ncbi:MAG: hypothetical protein ACXWW8_07165 [Solirubrobacterales bacterium]
MASRIVHHLRNHAVAYLALFLALSAGSFAAAKKKKAKIPPNSIGAGKLKDNAVKAKKIKDKAVQTSKLVNGAVTREKLDVKIPVAEAVGNIVYTSDTPTVAPGSSGINGVAEAAGGVDGFVCVDTANKVSTAVGNAVSASNYISTAVPAGGTCSAAADILVTVNKDDATQVKGSFSILAF